MPKSAPTLNGWRCGRCVESGKIGVVASDTAQALQSQFLQRGSELSDATDVRTSALNVADLWSTETGLTAASSAIGSVDQVEVEVVTNEMCRQEGGRRYLRLHWTRER
jgi:hypothetical protein